MATKITVKIDKSGGSTIENVCGAGGKCQELTAGLEKRLGVANEGSRQDTDELYKISQLAEGEKIHAG